MICTKHLTPPPIHHTFFVQTELAHAVAELVLELESVQPNMNAASRFKNLTDKLAECNKQLETEKVGHNPSITLHYGTFLFSGSLIYSIVYYHSRKRLLRSEKNSTGCDPSD
jgi:uncharacterized membrane protein YgdD (TMEM256/DUF423 family)